MPIPTSLLPKFQSTGKLVDATTVMKKVRRMLFALTARPTGGPTSGGMEFAADAPESGLSELTVAYAKTTGILLEVRMYRL
jgi:hypothetical protein